MASHGVARTARVRTDEQRQQELDKIHKYRALEDQLRQQVAAGNLYGPDTFQLTSKLLRLNPEYYTVWNVRRRCLISGLLSRPSGGSWPSTALPTSSASATPTPSSAALSPSSSTETPPAPGSQTAGTSGTTHEATDSGRAEQAVAQKDPDPDVDLDIIRSELAFTIPLLMEFPKCYWIWSYRIWILDQATDRLPVTTARNIWLDELGLVTKMLHKDRRNFHAWTYRRHVVQQLESPVLEGHSMATPEFDFTTRMIHTDLSNFSAWHNRSRLIPRMLDERDADDESRKKLLEDELTNIGGALNVGPEDQSLWYYHQFLILNLTGQGGRPTFAPRLTVGQRVEYILHEIEGIKELLEDYRDVKWIYEALIEYTLAVSELRGQQLGNEEAAEVTGWLRNLKELDPKRSGRWKDFEQELNLP